MHYIGIKCEECNNIANTKDGIERLPGYWIALVQRRKSFLRLASQEALHFCSFEHLRSWVMKRDAEEKDA